MVQIEREQITFTKAQLEAVTGTSKTTVVSAGAGTGKTAVLVERFVQLVLSGRARVDQILAITFTEKAAIEMKSRITSRLQQEGLTEEYRKIENAWISTVHSFCSRLLKENPFPAGIDPEFNIIDDAEKAVAEEELFDRLFDEPNQDFLTLLELYDEDAIKKALIGYIELQRSLGRDVNHIDSVLADPGKLLDLIEQRLKSRKQTLSKIILTNFENIRNIKAAGALEKKRVEALENIDEIRANGINREMLETLLSVLKNLKPKPLKGCDPNQYEIIYNSLKTVLETIKKEESILHYDRDIEKKLLQHKTWFLNAAKHYWQLMDQHKRDLNVLDYEDLQLKAKAVISDDPAVRNEYLNRFREVMVDEFQDINPLQKQIVELVAQRANLFTVGDVKQSIYGFRNADVDLMLDQQQRAARDAGCSSISLSDNFRSASALIDFYNDFFSDLWRGDDFPFEPLTCCRNDPGQENEYPLVQFHLIPTVKRARVQQDDSVAVQGMDAARQCEVFAVAREIRKLVELEQFEVFDKETERPRSVRYGDVAVLCRSSGIFRLYADAFDELDMPYYFLRSRTYFERYEVKDIINFIDLLDNPLQDIKLAALLCSPMFCLSDDTLVHLSLFARENQIESPWLFPAVTAINHQRGIAPDEYQKLNAFRDTFEKLTSTKNMLSPAELIERIIETTDYETRMFCDRLGPKRVANVNKLIDIAQRFDAKGHSGIGAFLRYYNAVQDNAIEEAEAPTETVESDSVKVMTVHAAKGLEFPVVVIADIGRDFNLRKAPFLPHRQLEVAFNLKPDLIDNNQYHSKREANCSASYLMAVDEIRKRELAEEKRLLYVASTRARDLLIFAGAFNIRENELKNRSASAKSTADWVVAYLAKHLDIGDRPSEQVVDINGVKAFVKIFTESEQAQSSERKRKIIDRHRQDIAAGRAIKTTISEESAKLLEAIEKQIRFDEQYTRKYFPARLSVTDIIKYADCPMKFYAEKVLGYAEDLFFEADESAAGPGLHGVGLGSAIHECFSRIDFKSAIEPQLEEIHGSLTCSETDSDLIISLMKNFLSSSYTDQIRTARKYRQEYPLECLIEDMLIAATVDLLWYDHENNLHLLDFKTDRHIPQSAQHELQMRLYSLMIDQILGYTPRRAILYYLRHNQAKVLPVSAETLIETRSEFERLLHDICENRFEPAPGNLCGGCGYHGKICLAIDTLAQQ